MTEIERRLAALNIVLPEATTPAANYLPYVASGNLIYLSGQLPMKDGKLACVGKLGGDLTIEEGYAGARLCAINLMVQIKAAVGDLSRVRRIVRLGGFVNSTPSFRSVRRGVWRHGATRALRSRLPLAAFRRRRRGRCHRRGLRPPLIARKAQRSDVLPLPQPKPTPHM
jgi:enamine deaminase RidA (YjgF/YER057c/UK114 family)